MPRPRVSSIAHSQRYVRGRRHRVRPARPSLKHLRRQLPRRGPRHLRRVDIVPRARLPAHRRRRLRRRGDCKRGRPEGRSGTRRAVRRGRGASWTAAHRHPSPRRMVLLLLLVVMLLLVVVVVVVLSLVVRPRRTAAHHRRRPRPSKRHRRRSHPTPTHRPELLLLLLLLWLLLVLRVGLHRLPRRHTHRWPDPRAHPGPARRHPGAPDATRSHAPPDPGCSRRHKPLRLPRGPRTRPRPADHRRRSAVRVDRMTTIRTGLLLVAHDCKALDISLRQDTRTPVPTARQTLLAHCSRETTLVSLSPSRAEQTNKTRSGCRIQSTTISSRYGYFKRQHGGPGARNGGEKPADSPRILGSLDRTRFPFARLPVAATGRRARASETLRQMHLVNRGRTSVPRATHDDSLGPNAPPYSCCSSAIPGWASRACCCGSRTTRTRRATSRRSAWTLRSVRWIWTRR